MASSICSIRSYSTKQKKKKKGKKEGRKKGDTRIQTHKQIWQVSDEHSVQRVSGISAPGMLPWAVSKVISLASQAPRPCLKDLYCLTPTVFIVNLKFFNAECNTLHILIYFPSLVFYYSDITCVFQQTPDRLHCVLSHIYLHNQSIECLQ